MIDVYYWPTPNGWKISIMLFECGLPFRTVPVNLMAGEQFQPGFLAISPNGRMPAIVDHEPPGGGPPLSVFESGAILLYLADKSGQFLPREARGRARVTEWLMWQMGGLGPMLGQHGHFKLYAPEKIPYAIERYEREANRLYAVLDAQLAKTGDCVAGEYSIADMAIFPWVVTHKAQGIAIASYPNVQRWFTKLRERPGVKAGMDLLAELRRGAPPPDARAREVLFGIRPTAHKSA
jgi:GST-like protein